MSRPAAPVHSALYEGTVTHARRGGVAHAFSTDVAMCYLDLDEVETVFAAHPLWSTGRWRPVRFRRADYAGDPAVPLKQALGDRAVGDGAGPVRLLAQVRRWGWCFNPLALGFCFDPAGGAVGTVVATVTNTPWGERHDYVLAAGPDGSVDTRVEKALHVSPFFGMDQRYRFRISPPGEELHVRVDVDEGADTVLRAEMRLRRRALDRRAMTDLALRHPAGAWRISGGIYREAVHLARKGATFHRHPAKLAPRLQNGHG